MGQVHAVADDRDQQQARHQHLDGADQRPHACAAHGRVPDLLRRAAVAVQEQFLAADAAQHPQAGHGVRGEFGGPSGLLALEVRPLRRPGQQGQDRKGQSGQAHGDHDAEHGLVDDQADTDQQHRDRRGGEAGHGLHEPADLLDVARGDRHDLSGRDAPGQRGAEVRGLVGEQLLDPCGGGDPVGDGGAVQEGVADRGRGAAQGHHPAGEGQSGPGAVDDGLDGEADAERLRGDGDEVQQAPGQGLELAAQLVAAEPPQEAGARAHVRHTRVGIRKVLDLHDVPVARVRGGRGGRGGGGGGGTGEGGGRVCGERQQTVQG